MNCGLDGIMAFAHARIVGDINAGAARHPQTDANSIGITCKVPLLLGQEPLRFGALLKAFFPALLMFAAASSASFAKRNARSLAVFSMRRRAAV
jgi:hypothetical protein